MTTQQSPQQFSITQEVSSEERAYVCRHLLEYNVATTDGLLKQPGIEINPALKDAAGQVMAASSATPSSSACTSTSSGSTSGAEGRATARR